MNTASQTPPLVEPGPRHRRYHGWLGGTGRLRLATIGLLSVIAFAGLLAAQTNPAGSSGAAPSRPTGAPRGQPIRPVATTNTVPGAATELNARVVTLPGGIVITNLPASVLPKSPTNTVRLPTHASRKFAPLGYVPTSFTVLARFLLSVPDPQSVSAGAPGGAWAEVRRQIPEDVRELDGRKVALAGFMLPLSLSNGRSTEFLLLRNQSACCFGLVPRVNELVLVKMAPPGVTPRPDLPVVVAGTLRLKWIGEGGQLTAIYEISGERFEQAEGP